MATSSTAALAIKTGEAVEEAQFGDLESAFTVVRW
jgi:hypothetical protein